MADRPTTMPAPVGAIVTGDQVDARPAPLTHAECDLRNFPYMPLDVRRLRDSETAVLLNGEEFRAAILLWCAAWHQVPAGSLPKDDRLLANLAGVGGSTRKWSAVRKGALRGFIECRDGRLYHPVVCEKVIQAIARRSEQRSKTTAARAALALKRAGNTNEQTRKDSNNKESTVCDNATTEDDTGAERASLTVPNGREGNRKEVNEDKNGDGGERAAPEKAKVMFSERADAAPLARVLFKEFSNVYRGPCGNRGKRVFRNLLMAGENAAEIIAAAHSANPETPAEQWLRERAWTLPMLPPEEPKLAEPAKSSRISVEAAALANEIAEIAGQNLTFLEPGWCGAAMRCQMWLDQGWPHELIVAGVRSQVMQKAPEKIVNVNYFDKGLARFIARHSRPVPQIIEQPAEVIHVQTRQYNPDSFQASQERGRGTHRKLKEAIAAVESGESS